MKRSRCNIVIDQIPLYPFPFRIDVRCTETSQAIHRNQQLLHLSGSRRKYQSRKRMHTDGNPCNPSSQHRQQSGFRCNGMYHIRPFLGKENYQTQERNKILHQRNPSFHRNGNGTHPFPLFQHFHLLSRRRYRHDFIVLGKHFKLTF